MKLPTNKAYIPTLVILILLYILHYFGNYSYFYVEYPGYDVMMHLLGGVGAALACYWVQVTFLKNTIFEKYLWMMIFFVLIGGFLWEWFEAYNDLVGSPVGTEAWKIDTTKDLINDTFGAALVYFAVRKKK